MCGPQDRVYELDAEEGRIRFGDGVHGAIPPAGQDNILVRYSFGGGSRGNIGPEGITGVTTTAAGLTRAYNFLPICGGNDMQSVELVERLGPQRLRHRGRAVTPADFEALVLEEFSQARAVRCFPNTDENGQGSPGKVTVVVLCGEMDSPLHATALCERIEKYLSARCDSALARGGLRVVPAQILTVNVTATLEVDAPDNAAAAEREAGRCLDELLDPLRAREGNPIGRPSLAHRPVRRAAARAPCAGRARCADGGRLRRVQSCAGWWPWTWAAAIPSPCRAAAGTPSASDEPASKQKR